MRKNTIKRTLILSSLIMLFNAIPSNMTAIAQEDTIPTLVPETRISRTKSYTFTNSNNFNFMYSTNDFPLFNENIQIALTSGSPFPVKFRVEGKNKTEFTLKPGTNKTVKVYGLHKYNIYIHASGKVGTIKYTVKTL